MLGLSSLLETAKSFLILKKYLKLSLYFRIKQMTKANTDYFQLSLSACSIFDKISQTIFHKARCLVIFPPNFAETTKCFCKRKSTSKSRRTFLNAHS